MRVGKVYSATLVVQPSRIWSDPVTESTNGDWCLYAILKAPQSSQQIANVPPRFGEDVFTIGIPDSANFHVYRGQQSLAEEEDFERLSMSAFYGNSGGGVFNSKGELVGLVTKLRMSRVTFAIVPQWAEYISIFEIKRQLLELHIEQVLR